MKLYPIIKSVSIPQFYFIANRVDAGPFTTMDSKYYVLGKIGYAPKNNRVALHWIHKGIEELEESRKYATILNKTL